MLPILLVACESMKTGHNAVTGTDFAGYRTFPWAAEKSLASVIPQASRGDLETLIKASTRAVLEGKGYRFESDRSRADFVLFFTMGARTRLVVEGEDFQSAVGYSNANLTDYQQGRLAIDMYDAGSKNPIWHGWASQSVRGGDQANPTKLIDRAVKAILANFPGPVGA